MKPKVAVVVSHPIQHFCPFYRALTQDGRIRLKVFFGATVGAKPYMDRQFNTMIVWQRDLLDGFEHVFLPGSDEVMEIQRPIRNRHLARFLSEFSPDVVQVYGGYHGLSRSASFWAKARRRRVLYVSDSELVHSRTLVKRAGHFLVLPALFAAIDGFLTVADRNEQYYRHYRVAADRLFRCPFPVDEGRLLVADASRSEIRRALRVRLGIPSSAVCGLIVGKLTAGKCVDHAVRALQRLRTRGKEDNFWLLIAGDGPEREKLAAACAGAGLEDRVRILGFVRVEELPSVYASADILIHPSSHDRHPLCTGEALFVGLPIVASDRVGSVGTSDDIRPGRNGLVYPWGEIDRLCEAWGRLSEDEALRRSMGDHSRQIAAERTMRHSVDGFVRAVSAVLGSSRAAATLVAPSQAGTGA